MSFVDILNKYGESALVFKGKSGTPAKIFIQPVMTQNSDNDNSFTRLGQMSEARYYYFGPPDVEIHPCADMYIACGGVSYEFVRAECYKALGKPSHWEAVLRLREEDLNEQL